MTLAEADPTTGAKPATTEWRPFSAELVAGAGRHDITPELNIRTANWGAHGRHEVATGVHQPLTVTALALADDSGSMHYVVSADLGWWRNADDEASVRTPVLEALGVEESQLLLHLVHTHAGPCTTRSQHREPGGELVDGYLRDVSDAVVAACGEARATARRCHITWAVGACALATVRDLPCGEADVVGFNPDAAADDTVVVGRITDHDERTVATIVNYACHPTTLAWQNPLLSPDFVGPARVVVEAATSAPCLFLQGASGDLAPRDQYTGDIDVVERNGRILGHAAVSTLEAMPRPGRIMRFAGVVESGASLGMWAQVPARSPTSLSARLIRVRVPLQPMLSPEELTERWSHLGETPARERVERAMGLRRGYVEDDAASHPVWIMEVGDAVIVAHPGEAYSTMQTELRSRHRDRCILVANCTNGPGFMYLPERSAYERLRYQVWQTLLGAGALETVIDAIDEAIGKLDSPRALDDSRALDGPRVHGGGGSR